VSEIELIEVAQKNELPSGWEYNLLGNLGLVQLGKTPKKSQYRDTGTLRMVKFRDVSFEGNIKWGNTDKGFVVDTLEARKGLRKVEVGDVLVTASAHMSEHIGKKTALVFSVPSEHEGAYVVGEILQIRTLNEVNPKWILYFLRSTQGYKAIQKQVHGVHLIASRAKNIEIPLAPPSQQKQIVDEIEKQFSRLDKAVADLKRVKANLKRYKASVLQAAVTGKLTEEWRKQHLPAPVTEPGKFYTYAILCEDDSIYIGHTSDIDRCWQEHREGQGAEWTKEHRPVKIAHYEAFDSREEASEREKWLKTGAGRKWIKRELAAGRTRQAGDVEPASKLLERILTERRQKWEAAELARLRERHARGQAKIYEGWQPKNDKWKEKYKEPAKAEVQHLPLIPRGWTWATLPQLGELNRGKSKHRPRNDPKLYGGDYPFIQTGDVKRATGLLTQHSQTYSEEGLNQSRLWPVRTLCITIAANIADTAILGIEACFPDSIIGFIPEETSIDINFTEYFIRTAKENLDRFAPATAQKNINLEILSKVGVPLPPVVEQQEIIQEIESRLSVAEEIERTVDTNLKRAERLRQSILKQAFSGKLV